jgi:hypothetical protein
MQFQPPQYQMPYQQPSQPAFITVDIGRRCVAVIIDGLLLGIIDGVITAIFRSPYSGMEPGIAYAILTLLYFTIMSAVA